jgi:cell division transport system permease protein
MTLLARLTRSDLPVGSDASGRFLPWLVAIMVFLAAMALAGVLVLDGMLGAWSRDLSGTLTVQVPPGTAPEETAARVDRAVRLMQSTPGIRAAEAVPEQRLADLLEPWLGSRELIADLPTPRLIDVTLSDGARPDIVALERRLAEAVPGAAIDDHRLWLSKLIDLAEGLRTLAWAVIALVALATATTVIHATRTALAVHRQQIEVLHLIGATDAYVARQFARRALWHGVLGGLGGLVLAGPALYGIGGLARGMKGGLVPEVALSGGDMAILALLPLMAGGLAMVAARRTVRRQLARMP